MMTTFRKPVFLNRQVELRFENGVVCIYGTKEGLKRIAETCMSLIEHPGQGHVHLRKGDLLTAESEEGAIAIFGRDDSVQK